MEEKNKWKPKAKKGFQPITVLNENHIKFCEGYAKTLNQTESYKKAYPNCKKDSTAMSNSSRLLSDAKIQEYVRSLSNKIQNDRIATISEIQEFWTTTFRNIEEKTQDRLKASELLGKSKGMFLDKIEHTVDKNISFVINSVKRK